MASVEPSGERPSPPIDSDPQPTSIDVAEKFENSRLATLIKEIELTAEELYTHCDNKVNAVFEKGACLDQEIACTREENIYRKRSGFENPSSFKHKAPDALSEDEDDASDVCSDDEYGVWDEDREAKMRRREQRLQANAAEEAAFEEEWQKKVAAVTAQFQEVLNSTENKLQENRLLYNNEREDWEKQMDVLVEHLNETASSVQQWQWQSSEAEKERELWEKRATEMGYELDDLLLIIERYGEQREDREDRIRLLTQQVEEFETQKARLEDKVQMLQRCLSSSEQESEKLNKEKKYLESQLFVEERDRILDLLEFSKEREKIVQQTRREMQKRFTPLAQRLAETERQNVLLKSQAEESNSKKPAAEEYDFQLEREIRDSERDFIEEKMQADLGRMKNLYLAERVTVEQLERKERGLEDEISQLKDQVADLQYKIVNKDTAYKLEFIEMKWKVEQATQSAAEWEDKATKTKIKLDALIQFVEAGEENQVLAERLKECEKQKGELEGKVANLESKITEVSSSAEEIRRLRLDLGIAIKTAEQSVQLMVAFTNQGIRL
ncbi:hypothetical protein EV426DRAFT_358420 [Tirmania nivea]|nr:hypothetical protein EV426DRAFT_358420 [Tirmania nivea]